MKQAACECGAAIRIMPDAERKYDDWLLTDFAKVHRGPGHGPISVVEARDIRHAYPRAEKSR